MAIMAKITLSMDSAIVAKAKRIAKRKQVSVSSMLSSYIASLGENEPTERTLQLPPITCGILEKGKKLPRVSADWDYRDELSTWT